MNCLAALRRWGVVQPLAQLKWQRKWSNGSEHVGLHACMQEGGSEASRALMPLARLASATAPPAPRAPPLCPTNALSNKHFRSDRNFLGPN